MENNDSNKKVSIILILMIVLLFSILIFSWLETFGIIGKNSNHQTTVSVLLEETVNIIPDRKDKKIVISKKEVKEENIEKEEKEKILEELKSGESAKIQAYEAKSADNVDTSRFYYNQINSVAKLIYDNLYKNIDNLKTGNYKIEYGNIFNDILQEANGTQIMQEAYSEAVRAFLFDNPRVFFLEVPKLSLVTETKTSFFSKEYNVNIVAQENETYLSSQFPTEAIVNSAINDIKRVASQLKMETEGYSQIDKIKFVHDYLVKNTEYDISLEKHNIHNIYGALINKFAVCEGYAKAFKYILDVLEVPSIIVVGNATNADGIEEKHSWNYIYIDGKWYGMDVTFDDPVIIGGPMRKEKRREEEDGKGRNEFLRLHTENSMEILGFEVEYPELEGENYN